MAAHAADEHHAHSHVEHGHGTASSALDFDKTELEQFDKDDVTAGSAIGRMLAVIFLYTILAMSIAGWWTYRALTN